MNELKEKSTDELIAMIQSIGVKLPVINYEFNGYESCITENQPLGEAVRGIEIPEVHTTFRDACFRIICWYRDE